MVREILAITLEKPAEFGNDRFSVFSVGEQVGVGKTVVAISRSISGLADVTSAGPGILGPNCPTLVVELEDLEGKLSYLAIPERIVILTHFQKKKKQEEPEIQMTKEG
jgi:hypothetical protein